MIFNLEVEIDNKTWKHVFKITSIPPTIEKNLRKCISPHQSQQIKNCNQYLAAAFE